MKKLTILILLAMAVVCRASAQNRVVTGTVSEEDGTPLTGAVVQIVGTNNAATAAIDGLYTLKNVPSGAVLRVSFWDTIRSRRRSMPTAWISYSRRAHRKSHRS